MHETKRKMAELKHTQILYFCSDNGHVSTETVSTGIFKLKCRLHMPVYLFADAKDDVFVTRHYYVRTFFLEKNHIELCRETNIHTLYCGILFFSQNVDEDHPDFTMFNCTHCEEEFSRGTKLDDIRDHLVRRSIRIPKFIRENQNNHLPKKLNE